ncbi:TPA: metal-sensitive transcriptional regulator [Legionella pneumophila]|uniref:metal-sensitive transcriptional regulator n=1 Tax=Legionella pneumophila TaxID=446 RepID=UPI000D06FC37|nr:metal-sensitive transcriptional regulator [Legionella pneumophila]MCH9115391.1 metal-sensitive transcriptional regulator [Legionella pneumophila serogroup 1]HAT1821735.1 metal-sensitive transcriptional regulator [Legionella pneumophila]HAU1134312.1 metal-sensitive transcriptional regulator [Legionella pneumophila]HAU1180760.1 metal-sensitive transcriptional regulator [Legionella pneumophila]HAU1598918.1 metal-sensitive transcriptional regulator [Legionella pneumophila]
MTHHPSHEKELNRINRVLGQLEGVKRMIEEKRYCVDIMSQLRAVRNAIKTIELGVLETHVLSCVSAAFCLADEEARTTKINEVIALLKKYD